MRHLGVIVTALFSLTACGQQDEPSPAPPPDYAALAQQIAATTLIIDTHIDVPYRLRDGWQPVTGATEGGDFDAVRAKAGGLDAPFMSIYTPAEMDADAAFDNAEAMIAIVERMEAEAPETFVIARSADDVEIAFSDGKIALPLGMENGSPIGTDLSKLDYFYTRGIRYITLTHSQPNAISDSSYAEERPHDGLSPFGEEVVRHMNELGIMVDISHVSDAAFWDALALTDVPMIASHSSARAFTPGFERNMADDMIAALAEEGGVIMINYGSAFLTEAANGYRAAQNAAYDAYLAEEGVEDSADVEAAFEAQYAADNPYPFASLDDVLTHIDHVVGIAGIDAVGIGSDYDGVGDSLPTGLKDVSSYPVLIEGLLRRGYSYADIRKILSGNLLRVWRAVEAAAG